MHERLERVLNTLEVYQLTYPEDACMVLADTEQIIAYLPGKEIDLHIEVGTTIQAFAGTVTERALRQNKPLREERGPERFGIAYISTASPIRDSSGEAVGVVSAVVANDRMDTLRVSSAELVAVVEELSAAAEELARGSHQVAVQVQNEAEIAGRMAEEIRKADNITAMVTDIANQSNLLGLNASIEAARAGEMGRGFGVVAQEIRKMATESKNAVSTIKDELNELMKEIKQISEGYSTIVAASEEHAAGVQEMKDAFHQITKIAEELQRISEVSGVQDTVTATRT